MIFNISHGVGKFATITVTAMANTTVTCVQSPYAYSKSTGSGTSVSFVVPKSGTWSITATYGGITKSSTVSVTSYQGNYPVTFTFEHWVFKTGEGAKVNIGLSHHPDATAEMDTTRIHLRGCNDQYDNGYANATMPAVDLSLYKTLNIDAMGWTYGKGTIWVSAGPTYSTQLGSFTAISDTRKIFTFDLSSLTGNGGILLQTRGYNTGGYIYNWWLSA